jgi:hypothetical protein
MKRLWAFTFINNEIVYFVGNDIEEAKTHASNTFDDWYVGVRYTDITTKGNGPNFTNYGFIWYVKKIEAVGHALDSENTVFKHYDKE